jgi:RNA polymerase sigma-70 factor (ECF subfamily)
VEVGGAELERHRPELTAYCYRMLGSPFDAEDAVQDTILRAWRKRDDFQHRAAVRTWLYRIATNVCLDMLKGSQRRVRAMDLGPAREAVIDNLQIDPRIRWIEPLPNSSIAGDPADIAIGRESVRLALVAALQQLPPRGRAALIMRDVLGWDVPEIAELLATTVAAVNSALQRARATLARTSPTLTLIAPPPTLSDADRHLVEAYALAFERYDLEALTTLIRKDARQSMPPYDLWLAGRDDIFAWWWGPGIACRGSRLIATSGANGCPAFGQYKPTPEGGFAPWALQVVELADGGIGELTFFLDTPRLFPLFGLPLHLAA